MPPANWRRSKKIISIRGLNKDHNLLGSEKGLFAGVATMASAVCPWRSQNFYLALSGERHEADHGGRSGRWLARLQPLLLTLWKKAMKASTLKN